MSSKAIKTHQSRGCMQSHAESSLMPGPAPAPCSHTGKGRWSRLGEASPVPKPIACLHSRGSNRGNPPRTTKHEPGEPGPAAPTQTAQLCFSCLDVCPWDGLRGLRSPLLQGQRKPSRAWEAPPSLRTGFVLMIPAGDLTFYGCPNLLGEPRFK